MSWHDRGVEPIDPATSFGTAAEAYDRARPGYPDPVVAWLLDGVEGPVADVGAGTGKLTASLATRRPDVTAVEPDAGMRRLLVQALPSVTTLEGSGESLPLDDHSVDLVTFAQAWHWVDVPRACREVARVLRRPGRLGLVWNYRDERDAWVARLSEALGGQDSAGQSDDIRRLGPVLAEPFGEVERLTTEWEHRLDVDTLVDLATSRSYVIVKPERERRHVLDAIRTLAEERADDDGTVLLPYVTYAFRTDVGGASATSPAT